MVVGEMTSESLRGGRVGAGANKSNYRQ
jgi:hypothetical protein